MAVLPTTLRSSASSRNIRIAAFGHRGVGKSTYLTALYAMLVNNTYRDVDFEYTDDDTAAKLAEYLNAVAENYSNTRDWQLPPTVSLPQELHFSLQRKEQKYNLNLIDYRGESTTIGEMTQNKDLLDFFSSCDGLMIFNANDAADEDQINRRAIHLARHQDLKYLFSSLKNRSGQQKLTIPVAMVYTKSDTIDFGTLSPEDWVEEYSSSMLETLRKNVQVFQTVFLSSQMAFFNVMDNDRFRLTETERSGGVVKCDTDVAYPLFWLLDQIQPHVAPSLPPPKSSSKWWILGAATILLVGFAGYFLSSQANSNISEKTSLAPAQVNTKSTMGKTATAYTISFIFNKNENRASKIYIRPQPSTSQSWIAAIDCGTPVKAIGEAVYGQLVEGSNLWQQVEYSGQRGYIHKKFLNPTPINCPTE